MRDGPREEQIVGINDSPARIGELGHLTPEVLHVHSLEGLQALGGRFQLLFSNFHNKRANRRVLLDCWLLLPFPCRNWRGAIFDYLLHLDDHAPAALPPDLGVVAPLEDGLDGLYRLLIRLLIQQNFLTTSCIIRDEHA